MLLPFRISASILLVFLATGQLVRAEDLSTELMGATLKVANEKSTATAFILSRPDPDRPEKSQLILITAAHVFEHMTGAEATLSFRRKEAEGVYKKVLVKVPIRNGAKTLWTRHPAADVAVLSIVPPPNVEIPKLTVDLLATDEALKKHKIHPGDRLMCLGYPHRVEANEAGFPVLRSGSLASFPFLPTKTNKTFLVDMNTFEGDSGGPVYMAESNRRPGKKGIGEEVRLILGLVIGQHFLDEEATMIYGRTKVRHRLGLGIVIQASFIREAIDRLPKSR